MGFALKVTGVAGTPRGDTRPGGQPRHGGVAGRPLTAPRPQSGFLSALLLVASFTSTVLGGLLADFLVSRKVLRLIAIRKLLTATGAGG